MKENLDYGITMNFNNEFNLFEFKDPNLAFSLMRGYWGESVNNKELLYTLDDAGFYIAIFQRAYILYEAWKCGEISSAKYKYASMSSDKIQSRFLTDFNFFYYSEKLNSYFVSVHKYAIPFSDTLDKRMDMTTDIFQRLCKLHNFPAIVTDAAELYNKENASNTDTPDCWGTLYENGYEL